MATGMIQITINLASHVGTLLSFQVMLAKNIDVPRGLVNGARGVVKKLDTSGKGRDLLMLQSRALPVRASRCFSS